MIESVLFYNYYFQYIKKSRFEAQLIELQGCEKLSGEWEQTYLYGLIKKMNEIAKYALLDYYNKINEIEAMPYSLFVKKLEDKRFVEQFEETYPVLTDLLNQKLKQEFHNITSVIKNVSNNYDEISEKFNIHSDYKMVEIDTFLGDSHKGKVVAKITFEDGSILMYKTRETIGEKLLGGFTHIFDIKFAIPYTIMFDAFCIQEYVKEGIFETEDQIKEYYHKFGIMAAIFVALGTTDLHSENVIASLEGPKFIDLETIISIFPEERCFHGSAIKNTMLFRGCSEKKVYTGMDLSAFSGGLISQEVEIVDVVMENDTIALGKVNVKLPHTINIPKMGNVRVVPDKYKQDVLDGFKEGYKKVLDKKEEFIQAVRENLKGTIRTVIRNTAFYATFLQSSYMPVYLISQEKRRQLFELLSTHSKMDKEIIQTEKEALQNSMIPLFEYDLENDNSFKVSKDMYFKRLEKINQHFFEQERNVLSLTFELNEMNNKADLEITSIELGAQGRIINECERYVSYGLKENLFSYVTIDKAISLNLIENNNDIFVFGGAYIVLAIMDKYNNETIYKEKIIQTLTKDMKKIKNISGLNGVQAEKILLYSLYLIYKDNVFLEILEKKNKDFEKVNLEPVETWDFSTAGSAIIAECILMLLHNEKDWNIQTKQLLQLYESNFLKREGNAGLFHGYAGDLLLFSTLSYIEGIEKYEERILQVLEMENLLYIESISNWNDTRSESLHDMVAISYGAPGILISRLFLHKVIKESQNNQLKVIVEEDIKKAVDKIIHTPRTNYYDDTLINGYAGGLFALALAKHMGVTGFNKNEMEEITNYIVDGRLQMEKSTWRCQGVEAGYLPNFMNGHMGIVFVLLLIDTKML